MSDADPAGPREFDVLRSSSGDVILGPLPAAPAGFATLPLPGATLYVDPTAPEEPAAVVVADPELAAEALTEVFGQAVTRAVLAASDESTRVEVARTDAAAQLARLGVLRWLATLGPLPIDELLLSVQIAVESADSAALLDPDEAWEEDLVDLAAVVLAGSRGMRRIGAAAAPPGLAGALAEALDALVRHRPVADPVAEQARHEAELHSAATAFGIGALDWDRWDELEGEVQPEAAVHAGDVDDPDVGRAGTASVDWPRVPRGVLSTGEGTVSWQLHALDADQSRLDIDVRSAPPAADGLAELLAGAAERVVIRDRRSAAAEEGLRVRVYVDGFGLPIGQALLRPAMDGQTWRGSIYLATDASAGRALVIDVSGAARRGAPRTGDAAIDAEALRWSARGVTVVRLASAGPRPDPGSVRAPWERARQLFAALAEGDGPDARMTIRRQARCEAVLLALAEQSRDPRAIERQERRLERMSTRALGVDLVPPDLAGVGWRPTAAELGLLGRQRQE